MQKNGIELYNLKKSARDFYNRDKLRKIHNKLNEIKNNNTKIKQFKNSIYQNIYNNAKSKKSIASSIKSPLLK